MGKLPNCENEHIKILQIDRNNYYGSDSASLNLTNLWKRFRGTQTPAQIYGENRDWNVDLIPKFVMANGNLVKLLLKTNVSQYLEWKCVDGTFVYQWEKPFFGKPHGVIHKVPATPSEALSSSLMGLLEKNRCRKFFSYINDFEIQDPKTYQGQDPKAPFSKLVKSFGLEVNTIDFIGHAVALYTNDNFLEQPSIQTIDKMQLYFRSISAGYGNSPFIYPVWGLSGLAEGFSRLTALYGGTYMLNKNCQEILYDEAGKFKGIKCEDGCAYAKYCIAEPSYVPKEKLKSLGKIIRAICILDHPLPGKAEKFDSCQIIIPQRQTGRKNDIFIAALNHTHCVCKKGYYLAIISTNVETNDPESELEKAYELLGDIKEKFVTISDQYEPIDMTYSDNVFITSTFDPLSHFEEDTETVISLYEKMTGSKLDLEISETEEQPQP
jgi:Rab GDP dissociation inhibitor